MYEFIPSQAVRTYAEKTGHFFSDMDIATILYHTLRWSKRTPALQKLAARTADTALRKQIEARLTYEELLQVRFETNDGSFFYAVVVENGAEEIVTGHYASAKAAMAAGRAAKSRFCVLKYQLADLSDADPRKAPLEAASRLVQGKGALDELFWAGKNYLMAAVGE